MLLTRKLVNRLRSMIILKFEWFKSKANKFAGIEAPKDKIHREEVYVAIQSQNTESVNTTSESTRAVAKLLKP